MSYRVGLIGCGRKGTQHARAYALNPATQVVAGADTDPENLELFCQRFGVPGYRDYREMLEKERIEIAAPILPVKYNPQVVLGCAEAGVRGILCEKPIAASLEETDRMVEACRARGIAFAAGDLDRNLPDYWKARQLIDAGELGPVRSISLLYGSGTEISGGGCQQLSLMRLFAQDAEVDWVIGWVAGDPFSDEDQGMAGYVRFVNGIECFIHRQANAKNGLEVLCSQGIFFSDGFFLHLWKAPEGVERPTWTELEKIEGLFPRTSIYGKRSDTYDAEGWKWPGDRNVATVQAMVEALQTGAEPRSSGDNGRKVLEIAVALRESHRQGHVPVKLPLADRNLKIVPHEGRWENKKEVYGKEWYAAQMSRARR